LYALERAADHLFVAVGHELRDDDVGELGIVQPIRRYATGLLKVYSR
jgi:hypothetical protein